MLRKFFSRDYAYFRDKGMKCMQEQHYAEARHAFLQALEKLDRTDIDNTTERTQIRAKIAETGDLLGQMNLSEAEHALSRGQIAKAEEHLMLLLELAESPSLKAAAQGLLASLSLGDAPAETDHPSSHCGGCSPRTAVLEDVAVTDDHLSPHERFELMIQPLPDGLAERYAALGDKFALGYLSMHEGDEPAGAKILRELLDKDENDILLYELALFEYRVGNAAACEDLLRRALDVNPGNPLCHLGLVQLLADTERLTEAIPLLEHMIEGQILVEQASVFLGDIYHRLGREEEAMDGYAKALQYPQAAKASAERLIPLLHKYGRGEEATFLAKKYLKGCC